MKFLLNIILLLFFFNEAIAENHLQYFVDTALKINIFFKQKPILRVLTKKYFFMKKSTVLHFCDPDAAPGSKNHVFLQQKRASRYSEADLPDLPDLAEMVRNRCPNPPFHTRRGPG